MWQINRRNEWRWEYEYMDGQGLIQLSKGQITYLLNLDVKNKRSYAFEKHSQERLKTVYSKTAPLHLMVRLLFWKSGECGVPCPCHYSQVHSDKWWLLSGPLRGSLLYPGHLWWGLTPLQRFCLHTVRLHSTGLMYIL